MPRRPVDVPPWVSAWLREQEPPPQQRSPRVPTHDPIDSQVFVRLKGADRRLRLRPEYAVDIELIDTLDEVQHELQALHRRFTLVLSFAKNRKAQRHLRLGRLRVHLMLLRSTQPACETSLR